MTLTSVRRLIALACGAAGLAFALTASAQQPPPALPDVTNAGPPGGHPRARFHIAGSGRARAYVEVPDGVQRAHAGLLPLRGLVPVLQDPARGSSRPARPTSPNRASGSPR